MGKLLIYAEQGIIIMMDNLPSEVLLGSNHHLMPFGSITWEISGHKFQQDSPEHLNRQIRV